MPKTRDEKSFQRKQEQILAVATQCFIESGFHATGMAKICKALGMSPGALYRYFPSKESIIEAIVERERIETARVLEQLERAENQTSGLAVMMAEFVRLLAQDRSYCQLSVEILAEASRNPVVAKLLAESDTEMLLGFEAAVRQGQAAGHIDSTLSPRATAQLLLAMVGGFIGRLAVEPDLDVEAIAEHAKRAVMNLLSPRCE